MSADDKLTAAQLRGEAQSLHEQAMRALDGGQDLTLAAMKLDEAASALEASEAKVANQAATIAALQAEVERAKEDERDRLYAVMCEIWSTQTARAVLRQEGAMRPEARSASRKENTP